MRLLQLKALAITLVVFLTTCEAQDLPKTTHPGSAFATRVEELLAATKQTSYQPITDAGHYINKSKSKYVNGRLG